MGSTQRGCVEGDCDDAVMDENEGPVWVVQNASVALTNGQQVAMQQANVYASGMVIDVHKRLVIGPSAYLWVRPA
jgi:hypothetical protein